MDDLYNAFKIWHVISFMFMSVPLFNLIVVNERTLMGAPFNYGADTYMENIIRHGAARCYVFQVSVFLSGLLLLFYGNGGLEALWAHPVLAAKTLLLIALMCLLSYVHFVLQPKINAFFKDVTPETQVPADFLEPVKPLRVLRKRMATLCLFLVLVTVILGMQVHQPYSILLNAILIALAVVFAWRVNRTLVLLGWV